MKRLAKSIPIELLNVLAFLLSVGTIGWLLWYYFDTTLDKVSALLAAATGGLIGTAYGFLPERTKSMILGRIRPLLTSETVFFSLVGFICVIFVFGFVCTRTVIGWKGELPDNGIAIDGEPIKIQSEDRTYDLWSLPFAERLISAQDLSRKVKSYPYFLNRVTLTDEELYAASPAYG
ncbi:hypothetical protein JQ597_29550 [Bradyrhizobium sp. AUGA SZCCT0177]|uniref:hypothetical protein n=1 Tax=Bradyrhizobium sp. AUGA SZCCT0177 TaxID=2807665 RepID=UPI001BAB15F0|nr:hypothetical protein [Bradyrhizobium sp. AUGA SZCCT0177]MBR1286205.1 hypothetical protein [Bradyrhizobium sp. AUGA SZCCT0177]